MSRTACIVRLVVVVALALPVAAARGQGSQSDYDRADNLRKLVQNKVFRAKVAPHWLDGGRRLWYRNDLPEGRREYVLVDAEKGSREPAFDHKKLAAALTKATKKPHDPARLAIDQIDVLEDGAIDFRVGRDFWRCDLETYALTKVPKRPAEKKPPPSRPEHRHTPKSESRRGSKSPDGKWATFVKDANLYLRPVEKDGGEPVALTKDGNSDDSYSADVYWSPDSTSLVAMRTRKGQEHPLHLVETAPKDQLQPKLHTRNYLKPGDRIAVTKPHLFDVAEKKEIPVSDELFPNPYQLGRVRWDKDSKRFTFQYNQRGHQVMRIIAVDGRTGEARAIVDEQCKTFFDYAYKHFVHWLDETGELIWMSERDGWNHLYLYDARTGKVRNQITRGRWVVRGVERVDEAKRQIWFRAGGIHPAQDPYYIHYCRIDFDGGGLTVMTEGDGTHAIDYSPDKRLFLDTYSRVDMAPVTELRRTHDGGLVCELERADFSALLEAGWKVPERFVAKGRDGKTDIHGVIFRPTTLDPKRKYPIIESIYAGPHGSFAPKSFRTLHGEQSMAELGFVLVKIDGMGTSNRSKAFHDVCWKNLGDSGFPDRIPWIEAAAKKYPYMDATRVGIYGGSAGGQSAMRALLAHPDFYKVAVADCGCHDNRMDKIWWNELWMGWPVGPHYARQSNVTNAHKLQGKLLLIVGLMDTNVDPASTFQVVDALIRADKDFDLLVNPRSGHGLGGAYGARRRKDFFVRHLLGVEPRAE